MWSGWMPDAKRALGHDRIDHLRNSLLSGLSAAEVEARLKVVLRFF
jgi:hypothetical protein